MIAVERIPAQAKRSATQTVTFLGDDKSGSPSVTVSGFHKQNSLENKTRLDQLLTLYLDYYICAHSAIRYRHSDPTRRILCRLALAEPPADAPPRADRS